MTGKPHAGRRRVQAVPANLPAPDTARATAGQPARCDPKADNDEPARLQRSRPPKVRVEAEADGKIHVQVISDSASVSATFGTADADAVNAMLSQLISVVCPGKGTPPDENAINALLALLHGIGPDDTVEGMLAAQLVACQHAAMDAMRRGLHQDQTPQGRHLYLGLANRLMATFATQVEALNRGRGRGPIQRVVVERVNVAPGAQAVVGVIEGKGGGG